MVKIIMGLKGSGKTKQLIDMVTEATDSENGDVICLEKGPKLTYTIPHKARLIYASQYEFASFDFLKGFISGLRAGNYDITHVFIDSLYKIVKEAPEDKIEPFLGWLEAFSDSEGIKFTITISADIATASEGVSKYF